VLRDDSLSPRIIILFEATEIKIMPPKVEAEEALFDQIISFERRAL